MSRKGRKGKNQYISDFDPQSYVESAQSLQLRGRTKSFSSAELLEELTKKGLKTDLARNIKPSDLDGLTPMDRSRTIKQLLEQISLEVMNRRGFVDPLVKEDFFTIEIVDWDTYAKRSSVSTVVKPLQGLTASCIVLSKNFLGHLEVAMRSVARHHFSIIGMDVDPALAETLYKGMDTFIKPKFIDDLPVSGKLALELEYDEDPSPALMMLIVRAAMIMHVGVRHLEDDKSELVHDVKYKSIPMFILLYNSCLYRLWRQITIGNPQTRVIDNTMGGFCFKYSSEME